MDITVSQSGYSTMYYKMQQICFTIKYRYLQDQGSSKHEFNMKKISADV